MACGCCLIAWVLSSDCWAGKPKPKPIEFRYVRHLVLDPGHGGSNLGALGFHATREKVLTLEISKHIAKFLRARSNLRVSLTRNDDRDIALRDRPRMANAMRGDVLISVHCNATPKASVRGVEVWFLSADSSGQVIHEIVAREEGVPKKGSKIAKQWSAKSLLEKMRHEQAHRGSQSLAVSLREGLRMYRIGSRFRYIKQAAFGVLKEARMPAVVLEVGYISHAKEEKELLTTKVQTQIAHGVLHGLRRFDQWMAKILRGAKARPGQAKKAHQTTPARTKR